MTTYRGFVQVRESIARETGRDFAKVSFDDVWNRLEQEHKMTGLTTNGMLDLCESGDTYIAQIGMNTLIFRFFAASGFEIEWLYDVRGAMRRRIWTYKTSIGAARKLASLTDSDTRWTKEEDTREAGADGLTVAYVPYFRPELTPEQAAVAEASANAGYDVLEDEREQRVTEPTAIERGKAILEASGFPVIVDPYPALTAFAASITPDDEAAMRAAAVRSEANSLTPTERDALHQLCGWDYATGSTAYELSQVAGADGVPLSILYYTLSELSARGLVEKVWATEDVPWTAAHSPRFRTTAIGREVNAVAQEAYAVLIREAAAAKCAAAFRRDITEVSAEDIAGDAAEYEEIHRAAVQYGHEYFMSLPEEYGDDYSAKRQTIAEALQRQSRFGLNWTEALNVAEEVLM
jgi:hypothetical protein